MKHIISYHNREFVYDDNDVRLSSILGGGATEMCANVDHYEEDTHVGIPTEEAVELAKEWIEENQK